MSLAAPLSWSAQLGGNHGHQQQGYHVPQGSQGQVSAPRNIMSDGIGIAKWVRCSLSISHQPNISLPLTLCCKPAARTECHIAVHHDPFHSSALTHNYHLESADTAFSLPNQVTTLASTWLHFANENLISGTR